MSDPNPLESAADGDPLDGFVIQPEPTECERAAAIIAGHDKIQALGVEGMTDFHGFVQEVLATTVEPEFDRMKRERDKAINDLCRWRSAFQACTPGGSEWMDPKSVREWMQKLKQETVEAKIEAVRLRKQIASGGAVSQ